MKISTYQIVIDFDEVDIERISMDAGKRTGLIVVLASVALTMIRKYAIQARIASFNTVYKGGHMIKCRFLIEVENPLPTEKCFDDINWQEVYHLIKDANLMEYYGKEGSCSIR